MSERVEHLDAAGRVIAWSVEHTPAEREEMQRHLTEQWERERAQRFNTVPPRMGGVIVVAPLIRTPPTQQATEGQVEEGSADASGDEDWPMGLA